MSPFTVSARRMRRITLVLLLTGGAAATSLVAGPRKLDTSRRVDSLSTEQEASLPGALPMQPHPSVGERREGTLSVRRFEGGEAAVGERRSPIEMSEGRKKSFFRLPEKKTYDTVERKESALSTSETRYSTREDVYRSRTAERFQEKISEARPVVRDSQPVVSKRTTWDRINRFAFRRNGGDEGVTVTRAGSGLPPTNADAAEGLKPVQGAPGDGR